MPICGMFESLAEYPQWFVIACSVVASVGVLWALLKLIRMALWALLFAAVVAGLVAAIGYFLK
jgi:hypothetical protein